MTRSLSLVLVLPLVLTRLSTAEIAVWYLFSTIINLQILVDVGFSSTFARVIAYGIGGATQVKDFRHTSSFQSSGEPNWEIIERISSTMKSVYFRLSILLVLLLSTLGTWSLWKPISQLNNSYFAWIAWIVILFVSGLILRGNAYNSYLQGINQIALLRRWESITSIGAIATSCLVLILGGGLLGVVIANQSWLMINVLRNWWLCNNVEGEKFKTFKNIGIDSEIFESVWPAAWRSGVGVFASYGLVQLSGIFYAQVSSATEVASYLLGLRLIQTITQFSQAPFYSKLPLLARLRSEANLQKQVFIARRGMALSYWAYTIGFITVGLSATSLLKLISSNAYFVSPILWSLLGLSMFAERYGAMHIQFYSVTNHIIWHIANGVSGLIYLAINITFFNLLGVYVFPIALLISYLSFYCWYSASHSYKTYNLNFFDFEKDTMLFPFGIMCLYTIISILIS